VIYSLKDLHLQQASNHTSIERLHCLDQRNTSKCCWVHDFLFVPFNNNRWVSICIWSYVESRENVKLGTFERQSKNRPRLREPLIFSDNVWIGKHPPTYWGSSEICARLTWRPSFKSHQVYPGCWEIKVVFEELWCKGQRVRFNWDVRKIYLNEFPQMCERWSRRFMDQTEIWCVNRKADRVMFISMSSETIWR
jgi:hypothetical protein